MSRNGVQKPSGGPTGAAGGAGTTPPSGGTPPSGAPQPGQAPPGVDSAAWQKALAACKSEAGAPASGTTGS
ncbi:MAG TPA: hypothetical protein VGH76_13480 [Actinomycetospora sp.]|jgi:hypothetical protein|uniref:hypothetical protein n=1 Tax=Actinomycetospora sp. TaxID=1872135 RepID=UPI002F41EDD0